MSRGWIKLNRGITANWLWLDGDPFDRRSAWIDLLLLANHKDHDVLINGKIYHVKRGEVNRSINQLMARWGWSKNRVLRFLKVLSDTSMITRESTTNGTTITIVNYAKYQDGRTTLGTTNDTTGDTTPDTTPGPPSEPIQECKEKKIMINNELRKEEAQKKIEEIRRKARRFKSD